MKIHQGIPSATTQDRLSESSKNASENAEMSELDADYSHNNVIVDFNSLERSAQANKGVDLSADEALKVTISVRNNIISKSSIALLAQANISPHDLMRLIS